MEKLRLAPVIPCVLFLLANLFYVQGNPVPGFTPRPFRPSPNRTFEPLFTTEQIIDILDELQFNIEPETWTDIPFVRSNWTDHYTDYPDFLDGLLKLSNNNETGCSRYKSNRTWAQQLPRQINAQHYRDILRYVKSYWESTGNLPPPAGHYDFDVSEDKNTFCAQFYINSSLTYAEPQVICVPKLEHRRPGVSRCVNHYRRGPVFYKPKLHWSVIVALDFNFIGANGCRDIIWYKGFTTVVINSVVKHPTCFDSGIEYHVAIDSNIRSSTRYRTNFLYCNSLAIFTHLINTTYRHRATARNWYEKKRIVKLSGGSKLDVTCAASNNKTELYNIILDDYRVDRVILRGEPMNQRIWVDEGLRNDWSCAQRFYEYQRFFWIRNNHRNFYRDMTRFEWPSAPLPASLNSRLPCPNNGSLEYLTSFPNPRCYDGNGFYELCPNLRVIGRDPNGMPLVEQKNTTFCLNETIMVLDYDDGVVTLREETRCLYEIVQTLKDTLQEERCLLTTTVSVPPYSWQSLMPLVQPNDAERRYRFNDSDI